MLEKPLDKLAAGSDVRASACDEEEVAFDFLFFVIIVLQIQTQKKALCCCASE